MEEPIFLGWYSVFADDPDWYARHKADVEAEFFDDQTYFEMGYRNYPQPPPHDAPTREWDGYNTALREDWDFQQAMEVEYEMLRDWERDQYGY